MTDEPRDEDEARAQIEVTEAMILAGINAIAEHVEQSGGFDDTADRELVAKIYREMVIQSRFGGE